MTSLARFALLACAPLLAVACVVQSNDPNEPSVVATSGTYGVPGEDAGVQGDGGPSAHPILAQVETNQTMTAAPGQGVGVFTEYVAGGHWHIWWTCDTSVNPGDSCPFDVTISVSNGAISNAATQSFEATDSLKTAPTQIEAVTTTSTGMDSITFDTTAGATIALSATVGGLYDGQFIFFVDNGKIDDGFQGTLTDPIQLAPSTP